MTHIIVINKIYSLQIEKEKRKQYIYQHIYKIVLGDRTAEKEKMLWKCVTEICYGIYDENVSYSMRVD